MSTFDRVTLITQFTTTTLNCTQPGHEADNHFHLEPHAQLLAQRIYIPQELEDARKHHESMLRQINYELYGNATIKEVTYRVVWDKVIDTNTANEVYVPTTLENHFEVCDHYYGEREFSHTTPVKKSA